MEFRVHLVFGEKSPDFVENFRRIWSVVDSWKKHRPHYQWVSHSASKYVFKEKSVLTETPIWADSLESLIRETRGRSDLDELKLSTTTRYDSDVQRSEGIASLDSYVSVKSWGYKEQEFKIRMPLARMYGTSLLDFDARGTYQLFFDEDDPYREAMTGAARNNLAALEELLVDVITVGQPQAMRLFARDDDWTPLNSFWTYFSSPQVVLDDLSFINEMWEIGFPLRKVPLKSQDKNECNLVLPQQLEYDQKMELWHELECSLQYLDRVTEEVVESCLYDSFYSIQEVPTQNSPCGFAVRLAPHFMNSYVSQFYVEVLKKAYFL